MKDGFTRVALSLLVVPLAALAARPYIDRPVFPAEPRLVTARQIFSKSGP